MKNARVMVRTGGAMLMSLVAVIGLQGVGAPATAAPNILHVTGTSSITGFEFVEFVSRGQQCLIYVNQVLTWEGDLEGTVETVRPSEIRYFATCDELFATGSLGIASTFDTVAHYVGTDGSEATMRFFSRTDTAGRFDGIIAVSGDLNGVLHESGQVVPGELLVSMYDGTVILTD